ncbi:hypothetical protein ACFO5X_07335 [Seohaeicola nanhaiensis]|uniref:XRE family transcriptional regulator n=1 Tax=Seohaeicola nanhaiensis TaxID=1387282 RepID=A0ABV9KEK0_9RHOB
MNEKTHKEAVAAICEQLGRKRISERIGVGKTAVGNAVSDGLFPARWWREIKEMCDEQGLECPVDLFNFISIDKAEASSRKSEAA